MNFVEELFDAILPGDRLVVDELELRHALQPEARSDLPPEKRRRPFERARRGAARLVVSESRVADPRVLQIGRHRHARDRDEADSRIVDLPREQLRDLAADLVADPLCSGTLCHTLPWFRVFVVTLREEFDVGARDQAWLDALDLCG